MTYFGIRVVTTCVCRQRSFVPLKYCQQNFSKGSSRSGWFESNPLVSYLRALKWVPIPVGVGFAYISYQQLGHVKEREERKIKQSSSAEELVAKDWQVKIYTALPLKAMSRLWGKMNSLELPVWMRKPLLGLYIWSFGCNVEEAAVRDLTHYRNLGEFFRRRLRPGCRPVSLDHILTSPSDGRILHFGRVDQGHVEQVKGITYTLSGFLGPLSSDKTDTNHNNNNNNMSKKDSIDKPSSVSNDVTNDEIRRYGDRVKMNADCELYHCVIYLAPGDYHGFHSPTLWTVQARRHFPGELLSVNPGIARWVRGLFNLNERVVYIGSWRHGFFSMAAVGATNVGSVKIYHDKSLQTNIPVRYDAGSSFEEDFRRSGLAGVEFKKGDAFGEFNLGSTIVLIFEAPKDFKFKVESGQKVKFGQPLGCCEEES